MNPHVTMQLENDWEGSGDTHREPHILNLSPVCHVHGQIFPACKDLGPAS